MWVQPSSRSGSIYRLAAKGQAGRYQVWTEKPCSEANGQKCWGSQRGAPALEGRGGEPDQEAGAQLLSCPVYMGGAPHTCPLCSKPFIIPAARIHVLIANKLP